MKRRDEKIALQYNLQITGTLQILLQAKANGLIDSLTKVVEELERNKFRFSSKVKNELLEKAGEK